MIRTLSIKNYAIINELEIKFSNNLSIITGETGAGKSIILGALGLIMGKRADSKTLYLENEKCIVEAVFDIKAYSLHSFFEKNNLDYEVETCIRREITPTGKSRAFVNDTPVLLSTLKELSNNLIDLHQQFDTLTIHDTHFQTNVIDTIANNNKLLEEYQLLYNIYKNKKEELNRLNEKKINANKESDFLNFQLNELTITGIKTGEIEALETELKILTNAEEIQQTLGNSALQINENENAIAWYINHFFKHNYDKI